MSSSAISSSSSCDRGLSASQVRIEGSDVNRANALYDIDEEAAEDPTGASSSASYVLVSYNQKKTGPIWPSTPFSIPFPPITTRDDRRHPEIWKEIDAKFIPWHTSMHGSELLDKLGNQIGADPKELIEIAKKVKETAENVIGMYADMVRAMYEDVADVKKGPEGFIVTSPFEWDGPIKPVRRLRRQMVGEIQKTVQKIIDNYKRQMPGIGDVKVMIYSENLHTDAESELKEKIIRERIQAFINVEEAIMARADKVIQEAEANLPSSISS